VRLLLLAAFVFLLVWGALVYVETQSARLGPLAEVGKAVEVDAESFRSFLVRQRLVHLLLCLAAADLVAIDRRARALQLYLARPLRRRDYVIAKALALALPLSLATWIPAFFLVILKTVLRADFGWLSTEPWLAVSILAYSLLLIAVLAPVTLALSSLSASPRHSSALFFVFLALSSGAAQVLAVLTRSDRWHLVSVIADLDQVASWLFRSAPPHDMPAAAALAALVGFGAAACVVLWRRIAPFDVVGGA
jgi:hypothetical protein